MTFIVCHCYSCTPLFCLVRLSYYHWMFIALSLRFDVVLLFLGPLWVVVKFAENGCLLNYVRKHTKQDYGNADYINTANVENEAKGITQVEKLRLAYGIAKGMDHLAKMKARMPFVW